MVGLATVLQGELKTAVEILALFHLSITTIPIQTLLAPQAEHKDFGDLHPCFPCSESQGQGDFSSHEQWSQPTSSSFLIPVSHDVTPQFSTCWCT